MTGQRTLGLGHWLRARVDIARRADEIDRVEARSSRAATWPVSIRERYGSITLGEVLRFHLVCWDTRRNLRRRRRAAAQQLRADIPAAPPGATVDAVGAV